MSFKEEKIILASASPRRARILKQLGFKFRIIPSHVKEENSLNKGPADLVKKNALRKAKEVAKRLKEGIVIGMDTVVYLKKRIFGKPKDLKEAKRFLKIFTLYPHWVYTGIAIIDIERKKVYLDYVKTKLVFHRLSEKEIDKYISETMSLDRAGGIDIEGKAKRLIKEISGDYYNLIGFPIEKFLFMIRKIKK